MYNLARLLFYTWLIFITRPFVLGMLQPPDSNPMPTFAADVPSTIPTAKPSRVARKIRSKKRSNVFLDDPSYPNQSHKFNILLHKIKGGPILCKWQHPAPPLDEIAPRFDAKYNKATHGARLRKELNLSYLNPPMREWIYKLLQKYWSVFDDKGLFVPVKDYKCSIDTGSAHPIFVEKINYGP
jgi:hypothetical protein